VRFAIEDFFFISFKNNLIVVVFTPLTIPTEARKIEKGSLNAV
jgi:hypothetical protein